VICDEPASERDQQSQVWRRARETGYPSEGNGYGDGNANGYGDGNANGYGDGDVKCYGHGVPRGGRIPCRAERP